MGIINSIRKCLVKEPDPAASALYTTCVATARQPVFYSKYAVPDTIDGRYDLLLLHVTLTMLRITDKTVNQNLFDLMFADMDRSLREMGVGDMSIGKKMKPMLASFYGRAITYQKALSEPDDNNLIAALARNLYGQPAAPHAKKIAHYMRSCVKNLAAQDETELVQGRSAFPPIG
jgi:cytochrome b pre-mRNA-processing protein 3